MLFDRLQWSLRGYIQNVGVHDNSSLLWCDTAIFYPCASKMFHLQFDNLAIMRLPAVWRNWYLNLQMIEGKHENQCKTKRRWEWQYMMGHIMQYDLIWTSMQYALNGKTSYHQISCSLEATKLDVMIIVSLWSIGSTAADVHVKCHCDWKGLDPNHAASRLHEILR